MPIRHIDHILIAMPAGREDEARAFYHGILGLTEKIKPPQLVARGGGWFQSGTLEVHLGVEKNFAPARKAHPAFIVDELAGMVEKAIAAGLRVTEDEPIAFPGPLSRRLCAHLRQGRLPGRHHRSARHGL
jgi:catechol 2,3-dioxygenase-like lactoylglutathione lyase family enzyme